jgi:hypothetical protein
MPQNEITQAPTDHGSAQQSVEVVAAFLLCLEEQEQRGLNRRCAVLAAGSELGVDPAAVVRRVRQSGS